MTLFIYCNVDGMMHVRHSIVASIPACHAGDRGSIPRDGGFFILPKIHKYHQLNRFKLRICTEITIFFIECLYFVMFGSNYKGLMQLYVYITQLNTTADLD